MKTVIAMLLLVAMANGDIHKAGIQHVYTRSTAGVVTDQTSGSQWQDEYAQNNKSIKKATWDEAQSYCTSLALEGHSDWRTPTVEELVEITDQTNTDPAIDSIFKNTVSSAYWSSLASDTNVSVAWFVYFYSGFANWKAKNGDAYVRCIRL